ncbi:membrane progestin receptor alpha-B [Latimeria chalumnae]|uniref:Progestin and adipoQ receptor family member 7 n=1 Tax=Latimeria chalumnae TaxID=7897 RepID=H3BB62_LATCH|nr:PREDICTED: membrane progestin receptor alpha [Latimeria chalumnae]|eukprot:XP_005993988.1 PREDICTED: membrane progestin receptor alpha [Latimeria chalumnae]
MATVVMEPISRLFINVQQIRQIPKVLEEAIPKLPCTVKDSEIPSVFRDPYIHTGYRQLGHSWRCCFQTLFQRHNETINIWTHLIGALVILMKLKKFSETVDFVKDPHAWPFFIIIAASFTYLTCSTLAHLLQVKSELFHYAFFFLDYVGVAVYQYGSALAHYYYGIEEEWHAVVRGFFLPAAALLGWLSCVGCCYSKYRCFQISKGVRKLCQVLPSGLAYALDISPVVHRIWTCRLAACSDAALFYHKWQVAFFLSSAFFFSNPYPEKLFPGKCDFFIQGHQIFHVLLLLCTLAQLEAVSWDYRLRRPLYEDLHGDSVYGFCALFFFTASCSALIAIYMRNKVKTKLCCKDK